MSVTEFLTLSRMGFLPHGVVVGDAIVDAGVNVLSGRTQELVQMSHAMRLARQLAVTRMRDQAQAHRPRAWWACACRWSTTGGAEGTRS